MTTTVEEQQHTLRVLDPSGDSKTMWNPENQDEIDGAKKVFSTMKKKGYLAYTVNADGTQGEVISDFDPKAGAIIMAPQLVGG